MPKILRIINRFNLGGPTYNVSYLTKYLSNRYETMLIGGPEEAGESSSLHITELLGIKPVILPELKRNVVFLKDYYAFKAIRKIIKNYKPDIVHTHASKAGAVGRLAAMSCGVPVIVHTFHGHVFHSYFGKFKTFIFKSIERFLAKRTTAIVTISKLQKHELVEVHKVCKDKQTVVIPLGFDLKKFTENKQEKRKAFRELIGLKDSTIAIGIIGRLAPVKNHQLFIDAIAYVKQQTQLDISGIIIGDGETKTELLNYLKQHQTTFSEKGSKSPALIHFEGWHKDVDIALCGLDLITLTSKNEGTPVSLIEAQAAGKFIVCTNAGGIKDILHPDCGWVAENAETFKQYLLKAVLNFRNLNEIAAKGEQYALEHFGYQGLVNDTEMLYNRLLNIAEHKASS